MARSAGRKALERLDLQPGDKLAVTGAAGTLGTYVIALAKQHGLALAIVEASSERLGVHAGARGTLPAG